MSSYLSNRRQCTQFNTTVSDFLEIKQGVPQGSILGPLLFSIYINELCILLLAICLNSVCMLLILRYIVP